MKQRTDTKNEAKNWYQKWSKELILKMKQRTDIKNEAKMIKSKTRINREQCNIAITKFKIYGCIHIIFDGWRSPSYSQEYRIDATINYIYHGKYAA